MNSVSKFTQGFALLFFATVASTHFSQAATINEMIAKEENEAKQLETKQQEMNASWTRWIKKNAANALPIFGLYCLVTKNTPLDIISEKYYPTYNNNENSDKIKYSNLIQHTKTLVIPVINILAGNYLNQKYIKPLIKSFEKEEKTYAKQIDTKKQTIASLLNKNNIS